MTRYLLPFIASCVALLVLTAPATQAQQRLGHTGEAAETAFFGERNFINLVNNNSNKCVELNGSNAQQGTCLDIRQTSQVWQLTASGAGFQITNPATGNCLEVAGVSLNPGANIQETACQNAANQQWTFTVTAAGLTIQALHSNLCMEVTGSSSDNGANIQQANCTGATNQEFRIGLPGDDYVINERAAPANCAVIEGGSTAPGGNLIVNDNTGSGCDPSGRLPGGDARFVFTPIGSDFQIKNFTSQLCLEVEGVSTDNGANISQAACGTQANKVWRLVPAPYLDGSGSGFNIIAAHSRKCLDDSSVIGALGATVHQWECNAVGAGENQVWDLVLVNSSPDAIDDVAETAFETAVSIAVTDNDADADGDPVFVTDIPRNGSNGTATISADRRMIVYTPNSGFLGTDTFDYQIGDFFDAPGTNPIGGSDVATVTVNVTSTATVQFINGTNTTGDVFVNNASRAANLAAETGTAYDTEVPAGDVTVELRQGGTTSSFSLRLDAGQRDIFAFIGSGQNVQLMRATEAQPVPITPLVAAATGQVKLYVLHAASNAGTVDFWTLDKDNFRVKQLGAGLSLGQTTGYDDVPADLTQFEIARGQQQLEVYRFPLNSFDGKAATLVAKNSSMFLVDSDGNEITAQLTTDTEGEAEVPAAFTVHGNYPNPFNPATAIRFDLPQTADVSVQVIDMLGRVVMRVQSQSFAAGPNQAIEIDASSLSSGAYLYRVIAEMKTQRQIQTGQMMLVK